MAIRAFISYSHKDADLLTRLHEHLSTLQRQQLLDTWTDREIHAGGDIDVQVEEQIEHCEIYLLLVSSAFIQSSYCFEKEFARACQRQKAGKALIVPVIVRECDWNIPELRRFKALPEDGKPVVSRHWHTPDEAFANIAAGLRKLLEQGPFAKPKPPRVVKEKFIPDDRHVTEEQRADLRKIAEEIVDRLTARAASESEDTIKKRKGVNFGIVWSQFNKHFNTVKYGVASLPREQFEEAKDWLRQYRASKNKNLKRADPQTYRNSLTTAIYSCLKSLDWTKEQLYAFASDQVGYTQPIESLNDLGNNQLEIIQRKIRYEITKRKVKSGQAKIRKKSARGKEQEAQAVANDLSQCPTEVLIRWVEQMAAAGTLTDDSTALREVQARSAYIECPQEDLAAFRQLKENVLVPFFEFSKLPPQVIHIPGAKCPPPPLYYQNQLAQNVPVTIGGKPSRDKPALEIVVDPRIVPHASHKCLELPMWIVNQGKTTADDVIVVLQKQPIGVFGIGYGSCSQATSGHSGNALKLNAPLNPGDRAFLCSMDLGQVEGGFVATFEPVEFRVKILARNQAAYDVELTFSKAELFAGKPKTAIRR